MRLAQALALRGGMALAMLACIAGPGARAATLTPLDEALAHAFPGARIEPHTLALSPADVKAVEKRAHARCEARLSTSPNSNSGVTSTGRRGGPVSS